MARLSGYRMFVNTRLYFPLVERELVPFDIFDEMFFGFLHEITGGRNAPRNSWPIYSGFPLGFSQEKLAEFANFHRTYIGDINNRNVSILIS